MNITADELFDPDTLSLLNNGSEYYVKEVVSAYLGRCYTLCHIKNMTLADYILLKLNTSWDKCYKTFY
jgi:hypothetical protein